MSMRQIIALVAALLIVALPAYAQQDDPPPPPSVETSIEVRAMLDAAMKAGDEGAVNAIVKYAKAADKERAAAFEQAAGEWKKARREEAERRIREARFLDLVKGRAEFGGYVSTGNSENVGLTGIIDLKREALAWRHKLRVQADYQESVGITTRERYLASYEPNLKLGDRAYVYGAALFESDRFAGFDARASLSAGAGYTAVKTPALKIDVELGPAFRHTAFTDATIENQLAARGKLDLDWKLSRGITFSQDAAAYVQEANSTVTGKTALRARLFGPFSAQMSYAVNYESAPPIGRKTTDTTSRASLLVDF
jgi:putative salt-induced outer membrane protein